jgi:hypothetical protein
MPSVAQRGEQGPTTDENEDERTWSSQRGAHIMGLGGEIGSEVSRTEYHEAIEQPACKHD